MQSSRLKGVEKSWTEHDSLVQKRHRRKKTLRKSLHRYFNDCHCDGIYLLIHEANRYFTINFNKDEVSLNNFPPPDKDIVSVIIQTWELS